MSATPESSTTDVESSSATSSHTPSISALFLIKFDQKVGYVIAWKRAASDITLDGAVEFKSLPSGLHAVKSDLVYFVHEGYAGLSAFVNGPASEAERNAHFVAVGILVPLSYGRLGRSWLHAHSLQKIASSLADDPSHTVPLEEYWAHHGVDKKSKGKNAQSQASEFSAPVRPGKDHSRARALSTITAVSPSDHSLPSFHPALSILEYIDTFGPLVFRLQEAALLRKRILFMTNPPIRPACEFVYNLSVLSSIPHSVFSLLRSDADSVEGLHRIRALFTVGIHDIPELEKLQKDSLRRARESDGLSFSEGWVACTTDEIITTKPQLYDYIVELPPVFDAKPQKRRWPIIKTSEGKTIKATQRDLWRYKLLRNEIHKYRADPNAPNDDEEEEDDTAQLLLHEENRDDNLINEIYDEKLIEPMTWSQLAYNGFMWWASAGERDAYVSQERDRDRALLGDLADFLPNQEQSQHHNGEAQQEQVQADLHTAIIAYFHRWTAELITNVSELLEESDEPQGEDEPLMISRSDISRLGLDRWSEPDGWFIEDFVWRYFGRRSEVHGANLECCGVKIC
jgi:hypothetical protein